jgi:hypothetical protein
MIQEEDIQECWRQSLVALPSFVRVLQGKKILCCPNGHTWQEITNLADALQWLRLFKGTANTLVLKTGKVSGITVIDDDARGDTNPALLQLIPNGTPTAITANIGHHFFFQYCAAISTTSYKMASIDLRNDGGLIFLPPSCIDGKPYRWLTPVTRDALVPMPEALQAFCLSLGTQQPWMQRQAGTKTYEQLTEKQKYWLNVYLTRSKHAKKGEDDRSGCEYALCCWSVKCGLSPDSLWRLVFNLGKFSEKGHGKKYFDMTYKNALRTA